MIKKLLVAGIALSFNVVTHAAVLACPLAAATTDAGFCASFKSVAECHCMEKLPGALCHDMNSLYKRLKDMFGSVENACHFQHDVPPQTCIDDWNCYRNGGKDSTGGLCSSTGRACQ